MAFINWSGVSALDTLGYLLAFATGILMGLIGAGGSILTSGLLVYIFNINPVLSASYTLLNVGVISLVGSVQYYRRQLVDVTTGLFFCLPAVTMVVIMRKWVMPAIPKVLFQLGDFSFTKELMVMLVFAVLMLVISRNMIRSTKTNNKPVQRKVNEPAVFLTGLGTGIVTGFVGAGGGFIIVPVLVFFNALEVKKAVGTSLFIITINTAIGFVSDYTSGVIYNWNFLLKFILVTVAGMLLSSLLITQIKTTLLKRLFAIAIMVLGCWIIIKELLLK